MSRIEKKFTLKLLTIHCFGVSVKKKKKKKSMNFNRKSIRAEEVKACDEPRFFTTAGPG